MLISQASDDYKGMCEAAFNIGCVFMCSVDASVFRPVSQTMHVCMHPSVCLCVCETHQGLGWVAAAADSR